MGEIMKPSEVLRAARELISVPERWTQGAFARAANGNPIGCLTDNATCFCSSGAILRGAPNCYDHIRAAAFDTLEWAMGVRQDSDENIATFNDAEGRTHAEVLERFDRAIARAEQSEAPKASS